MNFFKTHNVVIARAGSPPLYFPDLDIQSGTQILLLGPSGCGKTSLLSAMAGLVKPSQGSVKMQGRDIYELSNRERDRLRGQNFGFVFQTLHLLPSLTLRQNIALAPSMAGIKNTDKRLEHLITTLGLAEKAGRKPANLSQGEQQRGAIARAVIHSPKIIIADEPTSALDDANARIVANLLTEQAGANNAALIIATHDIRLASHFKNIIRLDEPHRRAA